MQIFSYNVIFMDRSNTFFYGAKGRSRQAVTGNGIQDVITPMAKVLLTKSDNTQISSLQMKEYRTENDCKGAILWL